MTARSFALPGARLVVLAVLALLPLAARAEVGSARRPVSLLTPGASFEIGIDGAMRFGGEVAASHYVGTYGLGAAVGFVPGRIYLEMQPAWVLGGRSHHIVLGINPGFTIDVTGDMPRYGFQATLWANYAHASPRLWASPLFPFARVQAVAGIGAAVTFGVMLKLPIPVP
jgi:hypothetical protein